MITISDLKKSDNFFLLAGPCVIEGEEMALRIAEHVVKLTDKLNIPYVFKGSYRKANRSRLDSFTGIGDEKALKVLQKVSRTFDVPVVTDIHSAEEAAMAAEYVDVLQIPAFLCRQTDLLVAAAQTGKIVNIKKGQFLSPGAMRFAADKVVEAGNDQEHAAEEYNHAKLLADRIIELEGVPVLDPKQWFDLARCKYDAPVDFGSEVLLKQNVESERCAIYRYQQIAEFTNGIDFTTCDIAKAGVAVGVDGLFMETHEDPTVAKSDGANMLKLDLLEGLLTKLIRIRQAL